MLDRCSPVYIDERHVLCRPPLLAALLSTWYIRRTPRAWRASRLGDVSHHLALGGHSLSLCVDRHNSKSLRHEDLCGTLSRQLLPTLGDAGFETKGRDRCHSGCHQNHQFALGRARNGMSNEDLGPTATLCTSMVYDSFFLSPTMEALKRDPPEAKLFGFAYPSCRKELGRSTSLKSSGVVRYFVEAFFSKLFV